MSGALRCLVLVTAVACAAPTSPTPAEPKRVAEPNVPAPVEPAVPEFRLPGDVRPVRYGLELTIVPDEVKVSGKVRVEARVLRPTTAVWMHAKGLAIGKATLNGIAARVIQQGDLLGLVAPRELQTGALAIEVAFSAPIEKQRSVGIYSEKEGEEAYAYTFFEAIDARRAFPCFDEPSYKVPWKMTFHVRQEHVALANAAVVREVTETGGMKRVELAETKPLPSYLVAFVVGPFEIVDGGVGGRAKTPIRFVIPKGRGGELGWAKQVTPRVVAALEDYFDMDYPFGKLDVAVVPRFWGTMEHPGLVAMGQPLTLIRPEQETRTRKLGYANILAHELAHYWFGDLVTMLWWEDTWLNESLGQWVDAIITDTVEPAWRYRDSRVALASSAMDADETLATRSIRQPVTTTEGIQASFDGAITYSKGSSVFRMFEAWVGEEKWRGFIRDYLRAHMWGNASAEDLLGLVRTKLGPNVEQGLRGFLEQPGVPRVKITCDAQKLVFEQTRSLPAGTIDPSPKSWKVPVCFRSGDAKQAQSQCVQLDLSRAKTLAIDGACPTWIIPNANANGYYRSTIDPKMATALLTPGSPIAKVAKPTTAERMMLVTDLRASVERDELTIDKVLALVPLLAADPDERLSRMAFEAAAYRADVLDDNLYMKTRTFFIKSFLPGARKLGWKRAAKDSDDLQDLRRTLLAAVAVFDPVLARQADQIADQWLAKRTGIDDDLVPALLASITKRGGAARFDQLVDAAKHARDRSEKQRLLAALGWFHDPALAKRAFELVRGKDFDLRDSLPIVYGMLFIRETRAVGFELVKTHIDELLGRMRDDEASWFLGALAEGACDATARTAVAELVVGRAAKYDGAQAAVTRGLERSDQCIAAIARQLPALRTFLAKY